MAGRAFTPDEAQSSAADRDVEVRRAADAAEAVIRRGVRSAPPFAHLTVRTCYSLRDGAIRPRELAAAAKAAGMTHVAITDRDGLYGAVRFAQAAAAEGITPVFGTDLALTPDLGRPGWEITRAGRARAMTRHPSGRFKAPGVGPAWLEDDAPRVHFLARTTTGYGDVCRTVTRAHMGSERSSPHLDWGDVSTAVAQGGAYVLLGTESPVGRLLAAGRAEAAEAELRRWLDIAGRPNVLLGVTNLLRKGDAQRIRGLLALADRLDVRAVATNDVRYLEPADVLIADVLECVRHQAPLGGRHLDRSTAEAWFKTGADMLPLFAERPDLLRAAQDVAATCEVDLGIGTLQVPRLSGLADEVAAGELHRRCWSGVAERFPRVTPQIRERLERELTMVDRLGLHDYFLSTADIMDGIREIGVLAACRGSAAGSLVCYALRISDVDPVTHDLAFERFMNPYRDELPDIDIDVESHRREDVYKLILARYGEERTSCVAMVETFQARMAIREVGKALGLPPDEIGHIAKSFTHAKARDVRKVMDALPELKGARLDAGKLETLFDIVERIDGFPRHLALHPCGILLADTHLQDRTPLQRSANGHPMSQFDKDDVAALGMLKLDILGVRMLSAMRHCLDLVNGEGVEPPTRSAPLDLADIPSGDRDTYELICSTHSVGMFQIESPGQRELLGRLRPDDFGDLITEISLFRPGPVKADMVTPFVKRRHGQEQTVYAHPALEPVLRETHGVIVYHEQVMRALSVMTGCDLSYADLLRRQLGDGQKIDAMHAWAVAQAVDRGFAREDAEAIWDQIASFASFGFCKAHAAAFAVPTYRSAWLKAHVLPEFHAGLLTHDPGMYPRRLILDDARNFGVAILPPDVNRSVADYTVEIVDQGLADHLLGLRGERLPTGWRPGAPRPLPPSGFDAGEAGGGYRYAIRVGLKDVRGITADEIDALIDGRPFTSLSDLRNRGRISRPTAEHLCRGGALDFIAGIGRRGGPRDRRKVLLAVEELWAKAPRVAGPAEQTALDLHADHDAQLPPQTPAEVVRDELAVLGMDVSRHVVSFYAPLLEALGVIPACELDDQPELATVRVAGVKVAVQSPAQRSGNRVLFLSLDDGTDSTQLTYFSSTLEDCAWTILHAWLVVAEGRVSRRGGRGSKGATVTATRAWDLSRLWRAWQEGWLPDALNERGTPLPHQRSRTRPEGLVASEWGRGSR